MLPPPSWQERLRERVLSLMSKRLAMQGGVALAALVLIGVWWFWQEGAFTRPEFEEVYVLVPDKVSQSAAIPIRLPEGVRFGVEEAARIITFDPELKGDWHLGDKEEK